MLILFSYTPSWDAEHSVYEGMKQILPSSVRPDLVFMDTKNIDRERAEEMAAEHIRLLRKRQDYDAVIAVDDDALDFILQHRVEDFADTPVIFNNINSRELAEEAAKEAGITGIYETFFGAETVEVAKSLYPGAQRVVGISDHSLTGIAMSERFMELEGSIPNLGFETLDMMELSRSEIIDRVSSYGKDTIVLYLNFTQDKDGNLYGMEEAFRFLTDNMSIPLFKPDESGIGSGVLGGCGASYEEAGERTAETVMRVLDGGDISGMGVEEMEGHYIFDANLLDRYQITRAMLPAHTRFVNEKQTFWEEYGFMLRPVIVVMLMMAVIVILLVADRHRLESMVKNQKKLSDAEVRRRKAESQSYAVGQFLSTVSHDLRTPLVSIIGFTDLALMEKDEAKRTEYLEKISSSASILTGLVSDTLDVSKIISGKTRINPVPTTFDKVVQSVVTSVSETARKKRVRFYCQIEDGDVPIRADQMKLQRVILNLLTNAVKFTPEGGQVTLEIEHLAERVNGCNYRICVTDTGIGMSREFQRIMFEPFVQEHADPLHMGDKEGTGLGLTIVRNNVEQMGGFIDVRSEEGQGTRIATYLPIDVREAQAEERRPATKPDYSHLSGMHVLVVEDSDMNAEVIRAMLAKQDVTCVCVADGKQAVEEFERVPAGTYQAVFMDLRMPVMNGYEATERIRSLKREDAAKIPIFALSADVYEEDIRKARRSGMNGHIAKPVRPEDLYNVLSDLNIP